MRWRCTQRCDRAGDVSCSPEVGTVTPFDALKQAKADAEYLTKIHDAQRAMSHFFWMKIEGQAFIDDFGLVEEKYPPLVVSERALGFLEELGVPNAVVSPDGVSLLDDDLDILSLLSAKR